VTRGRHDVESWFSARDRQPFAFQQKVWTAWETGQSGLLNAPTGSGKTLALFMPTIISHLDRKYNGVKERPGLKLLWITPLRALTIDIARAMEEVISDLKLDYRVRMRTGDTSAAQKRQLRTSVPEVLLTTPESMHIMLSQKGYPALFSSLEGIVIDEWHELLGSKRGVQVELALSRLKATRSSGSNVEPLRVWGISATIGNLEQAADVLLGPLPQVSNEPAIGGPVPQRALIKAGLKKKTEVFPIIPENVEEYSWTGHLGVKLLAQVIPVIEAGKTTLLFTNTRGQAEIWYHAIINQYPEYAGIIAMHHGSLGNDLRNWVEQALHEGQLKLVICTSSLDLGVDFRPVDTVVQIGSPKGVARFLQRAGRSGHYPGATSRIFFVPTHSLELMEGAALKLAMDTGRFEDRDPVIMALDVLVQYLMTLALSEGFAEREILPELRGTYSFGEITSKELREIINFLTQGGGALTGYDEYHKIEEEDGRYRVTSRRTAMQHRMSIGTIVGASAVRVAMLNGSQIGTVEETFISRLKIGDTFWFAGRSLELVRFKEMTAFVRKASGKKGQIPSWDGGRMPLSSQLSALLRYMVGQAAEGKFLSEEMMALIPVFRLQEVGSALPREHEFLIEKLQSKEGCHIYFYPFEGRLVHEGLASLVAWRLGNSRSATFSIAMNDYGFELLADRDIDLSELEDPKLFSDLNLLQDIMHSLNANEMARRRFRDIAHIAGLVFTGFPGKQMKNRHLQANTSLLFDVFREYEPDHFLLRQAYREALQYQLEEFRLRAALRRISSQKIVFRAISRPSPFSFPILVDSMREKLSTESLEERVKKMVLQYDVR